MDEKRRQSLLEKTARAFDLPVDALAGLPRLELVGDGELRMENHRGILSYGTDEIHISGGAFGVRVSGTELELRTMNSLELLITGRIRAVELI
ncbi:MAG: sporulation protein [Oscillospiraceae bacterium]|nr:sporulation protein [Oscillospiraceae bacterium]